MRSFFRGGGVRQGFKNKLGLYLYWRTYNKDLLTQKQLIAIKSIFCVYLYYYTVWI